jgi:hypothetical protein
VRRRRVCPKCGGEGPHLVPPSFGDPGIWICEAEAAARHREPPAELPDPEDEDEDRHDAEGDLE